MLRVAKFTFNPFQENTYVIHDGKEAIVVDPGCWNSGEEHELEAYLAENALTPVRLVLTHAHIDHVLGCTWMRERYGLLPELHRSDLVILRNAPISAQLFGVSCDPPPEPIRFIAEGDVIELGAHSFKVLFVPGHAPGHIALYHSPADGSRGWVMNGDVLFRHSIGRTDLPGGNLETLLKSIRTQLFTLPDDTLVYCGHGPETTIGEERARNPFLR